MQMHPISLFTWQRSTKLWDAEYHLRCHKNKIGVIDPLFRTKISVKWHWTSGCTFNYSIYGITVTWKTNPNSCSLLVHYSKSGLVTSVAMATTLLWCMHILCPHPNAPKTTEAQQTPPHNHLHHVRDNQPYLEWEGAKKWNKTTKSNVCTQTVGRSGRQACVGVCMNVWSDRLDEVDH